MNYKHCVEEKDISHLTKLFTKLALPYAEVEESGLNWTKVTKILYTNIFKTSERLRNACGGDYYFTDKRDFVRALKRANLNYFFSEEFEPNDEDRGFWEADFVESYTKCYNEFKSMLIEDAAVPPGEDIESEEDEVEQLSF